MPDQLQKLQAMFEAHDKLTTGMASVKDVKRLFDMLLGVVKDLKAQLEKQVSSKHEMSMNKCEIISSELNDVENRLETTIQGIQQSTSTSLKGLKGLINEEISRVSQLIPTVKDYTSDIGYLEDLIKSVEKKIPSIPDELSGETIIGKINNLPTDPEYQIGREHIKGLDEEFKRLSSVNTSSPRGIPRIPKWQQKNLSGLINGVNTVFTFEGGTPIEYSDRIFLNYVEQNPLTDYTISGRTITYTVAPDASLSGLPHIIRSAYQ